MFNEVFATQTREYKDYGMIFNLGVQTIHASVFSFTDDDFTYQQRFIVEGAEFQDYAKQWLAKVATFYAKRQEKGIQDKRTIDFFKGK